MRKFNFDNLNELDLDRIDLFSPFADIISGADITNFMSRLNLSFAAPQPIPLFAEINGTSGNDTLNGTVDDDFINGLAGDDVLVGEEGDDALNGGGDNDVLFGGAGADIVIGGIGLDTAVYISADPDDYFIIETEPLQYTVEALNGTGEGFDTLYGIQTIRLGGLNGTDYAIGDVADVSIIYLTNGDDDYTATSASETINGLEGDDIIRGLGGDDIINGDAGDDILIGGEGADRLDGGAGIDTASYAEETSAANIDLSYNINSGAAEGDGFFNIENLIGNDFRNVFRGDDNANVIEGRGGDDFLHGRSGDDILLGGDGDDNLNGANENDTLIGGAGNDTLIGGNHTDVAVYSSSDTNDYLVTETTPGEYTIQAIGATGEGTDTLTGIEIIRLGGTNGTDYVISDLSSGPPIINLTNGNDDHTGTSAYEIINGLDGNDIIRGAGGDDILNGNAGNDILIGGEGGDALNGGDGNDTASYEDASIAATVNLRIGTVLGAAIGDSYSSIENLTGSDFDDTLTGDFGVNILTGGLGGDVLNGDRGNDVLHGGGGDDTLNGGNNNDTLYGGLGNDDLFGDDGADSLYGGAGDDRLFLGLDQSDTILDGGSGFDVLWTELPETVNNFAAHDINLRPIQLDGIEALNYYWTGPAYIVYANLEINASQLSEISVYHNLFIRTDVYFDTSNALDLTNLTYSGNIAESEFFIYGRSSDETVIASDSSVEFEGGAGSDTLILSATHADEIDFEFLELADDTGHDVLDASMIPTIQNDPNGDNGLFTFDLAGGQFVITNTPGFDRSHTAENYETAIGWDGDDIFIGDASDNTFIGNGGNNIAVYSSSNAADYFIFETAPGEYSVNAIEMTDEGTDMLTGIDTIRLGGINGTDYTIGDLAVETDCTRVLTNGDDLASLSMGDVLCALGGDDHITVRAANINTPSTAHGGDGFDTLDVDGEYYFGFFDGFDFDENKVGGTLNFMTGEVGGTYEDIIFSGFEVLEFRGGGLTDTVTGGDGNDIIDGGSYWENWIWDEHNQQHDIYLYYQSDFLYGMGGDDILMTSGGNDTLDGGAGDDLLNGGWNFGTINTDNDTLIGGDGIDTAIYRSDDAKDYIFTETAPGEYTVEAIGGSGEGTDTLTGIEFIRLGGINGIDHDIAALANGPIDLTTGDDVYSGTSSDEVINALAGDDIIDGGTGNNTLNGDAGNDTLISLGNDTLNGGIGNDTVEMGSNVFDTATATDGGNDIDTISFSTLAQFPSGNLFLVIDLQGQAYSVRDGSTILYVDQFLSFENATGSEFRDLLQGDAGANVLSGLGGDDNLQGRDGDDILDGGAGADALDGGAGFDIASYASASAAIVFDGLGLVAASGEITNDTFISIEAIRGTDFNDRFFGDNDASIFYGGEGADRLFGRNGDDELYGEDGNDIILGGRDNDLLDGGAGNDQLRGNEGDDSIFGGDGNDAITGGAGADAMDGGAGIDRVEYTYGTNAGVTASLGDSSINTGDAAGDTYVNIENLYGTSFDDELHGDAGNNRIEGRVGDDVLFGGDGNDYLLGGSGDDVLNGESGNDLFLGQAGADIYQFAAAHGTDRIVIFTQGEDLIEFTENVFDFSGLTITQDGAHVNIVSNEGTIIVNNSLVADFAADDFTFATPPSNEPLGQEPLNDGLPAQDMIDLMAIDFEALI